MVLKVSYRYRKYVWLGGVALAGLLLYFLVWTPLYESYRSTVEQADVAESKLERSRKLVEQQDALNKELRQLEGSIKALEGAMFQGETPASVGARMQEITNTICLNNGADIKQTRVLEVKDVGPYKEISINMDMVSSVEGLSKIVYELSNHSFLFLISEMDARSTGTAVANNIRARLTVVGFMREK